MTCASATNGCSTRASARSGAGRPVTPLGDWTLAQAVAASSCAPGAFGVVHAVGAGGLTGGKYTEPDRDRLVREIDLSDGGMFDNLGLESV